MKRSRERDNLDDDDVKPPIGPKRSSFKISPEAPSSNPTTNQIPPSNNPNNNNNNNVDAIAGTSIGNNKEQDRFLPIANVGRIMKKVIPPNGKISKDAKETVQECVSEFISFITGEASDKCQKEKRKTINGDDILWAIMTLGFEDYVTPLKSYLTKYREIEGEKVNIPKQQQQQHHQQQQRVEHHMQHDHNVNIPFSSVYPVGNLMSQPSFVPTDPPFPLPFSQNPLQTTTMPQQAATLPHQDHVEDQW